MNFMEQIEGCAKTIIDVRNGTIDLLHPDTRDTLQAVSDRLYDIALSLDIEPKAADGGHLELIGTFPYPHPDDRDRMRLALYKKPCPSGDGSGEYIIWTESREPEHNNGYTEANRFWGFYFGYVGETEQQQRLVEALDKFQFKCARLVGPFKDTLSAHKRAN